MVFAKQNPMTWLVMAAMSFFLLLATGGAPTQAQQDPYSGQPDASVAQQSAPQQQQGAPPPAASSSGQPYATETPQQLQQLVAPIALYPDSLVASILAASSDPAQITEANTWLQSRRNLRPQDLAAEADKQPWDPSVKALLPFPPVLQNMASNLSWTSELGDAYYNQQTDVMNAIQGLRQQAKKAGTLKSNAQIKVTDSNGYISIDPANISPQQTANPQQAPPQTVYIPSYDPWAAYGYPIEPWPGWVEVPGVWWNGPGLYFGLGFGISPFWGYGWGWPMWGINWYGHGLLFNRGPYFARGPAFFNRYNYYRGAPGFARPLAPNRGYSRGFVAPHAAPGVRSGAFGGYNYGGNVRNYSSRGQGSVGGGFHGGGFGGGGFRGGGGVRGGGGGRR
jgi:uncharacterized membrane protein YgcG